MSDFIMWQNADGELNAQCLHEYLKMSRDIKLNPDTQQKFKCKVCGKAFYGGYCECEEFNGGSEFTYICDECYINDNLN